MYDLKYPIDVDRVTLEWSQIRNTLINPAPVSLWLFNFPNPFFFRNKFDKTMGSFYHETALQKILQRKNPHVL